MDVRSIDYGDVFRRYVDFISFAHLPLRRQFYIQADNTSITEWRLPDGGDNWWLVRYNDAAHLLDL